MIERWFKVMLLAFVPLIFCFFVPARLYNYFLSASGVILATGVVMAVRQIRRDRREERERAIGTDADDGNDVEVNTRR